MADYGPVADVKEFVGCWHPWTWGITGEQSLLPYRLQWPNNYDSEKAYPLFIMVSGGVVAIGVTGYGQLFNASNSGVDSRNNVGHLDPDTWILQYDPDVPGSPYNTEAYEAFVLIPQMTSLAPNGDIYNNIDSPRIETKLSTFGGEFDTPRALNDLVEKLIDGTIVFYADSDVTDLKGGLPAFAAGNINADKVYMAGFSLGGGATIHSTYLMRDKLAGVWICGGWPIGTPSVDHYQESSPDYDRDYAKRLKRRAENAYHIPAIMTAGVNDGMWDSLLGLYESYSDMASEKGVSFIAYRISKAATAHDEVVFTDLFDTTNFFNPADTEIQSLTTTQAGYVTPLDWLFSLTKPTTPEDAYPIPDGEYYSVFGLNSVLESKVAPQTVKRTKHDLPLANDNLVRVEETSYYTEISGSGITVNDVQVAFQEEVDLVDYRIKRTAYADLEILTPFQSAIGRKT